jgi:hypothetical protein
MDTERDRIRLRFPLWPYLTQPLFSPEFKSLNPLRFWRLHNAEQLESCWLKYISEPQWIDNPIQFLEDCWSTQGMRIELSQDPHVVQFLEGCWDKELPPMESEFDKTQEHFDESEEYY